MASAKEHKDDSESIECRMFADLDKYFTEKEIHSLKVTLRSKLNPRDYGDIKFASDICVKLSQKGLITLGNYNFLKRNITNEKALRDIETAERDIKRYRKRKSSGSAIEPKCLRLSGEFDDSDEENELLIEKGTSGIKFSYSNEICVMYMLINFIYIFYISKNDKLIYYATVNIYVFILQQLFRKTFLKNFGFFFIYSK